MDALLRAGAPFTDETLARAADGGSLPIVERLIAAGAPHLDHAVMAAAIAGHADVVEALLPRARRAHADLDLDRVLDVAIGLSGAPSREVVDVLLRAHANPDRSTPPLAWTALHRAAQKDAAEVVAALLAAGAPVDARASDDETPLIMAARAGRGAVVETLLAAGADPRAVNERGETALSVLIHLDSATPRNVALLEQLLAAKVPVDHGGPRNVTPLMIAASIGSVAWIETLLAHGASLEARDADGRRPIDHALACLVDGGDWPWPVARTCHGAAARALLAPAKAPLGSVDRDGRSPLMRALMTVDDALVARMLALGARAGDRDPAGTTIWHYAARYATPGALAMLVAAKLPGLDAVDARGETPLALARRFGRRETVAALVAAGAR